MMSKASRDVPRGALVVCSDANWLWQSAFVLRQAIESDPSGLLDFYYAADFDVASSPLARVIHPRVRCLNLGAGLEEVRYDENAHIPKATFLRFLAIEMLSQDYERVIYVDADVFLSWGTWVDLLRVPLGKRAVAAVHARAIWFNSARARYGRRHRQALGSNIGDNYLNAGMLLINSSAYQNAKLSQKALDFFSRNPDLCAMGDQSALNAVLDGDWDALSPSWNWQVSPFNFPALSLFNPRVIHFTGPFKPWNENNGLFTRARNAMASFLGEYDLRSLLPDPPVVSRRWRAARRAAKFREDWFGNEEDKLARFDRYLERRDFIDTEIGLEPFDQSDSGFGSISTLTNKASPGL